MEEPESSLGCGCGGDESSKPWERILPKLPPQGKMANPSTIYKDDRYLENQCKGMNKEKETKNESCDQYRKKYMDD